MDDSGPRNPDHKPQQSNHNNDWFSLGGVLIEDKNETMARDLIAGFCEKWKIVVPLHSVDIRHKAKGFRWLAMLEKSVADKFYMELGQLMVDLPVIGLACVIDRPGYKKRYVDKFGRKRWMLCKTAFNICVERAAKYAISQGAVLRILPEKCSKKDDNKLKEYYDHLKKHGLPFDQKTSGKYAPLDAATLNNVLYDFKTKNKSSPLAQVADLYLWPMCKGGYHEENRPYQQLLSSGKLMDNLHQQEDVASRGIKYSCFELAQDYAKE